MPKRPTARDVANAYTLLGVSPQATPLELKSAHRDLVKIWHPDRFENDARLRSRAAEKLRAINAAYDILLAAAQLGVEPALPRARPASRPLWPVLLVSIFCLVAGFVLTIHFGWSAIRKLRQDQPAPAAVAASMAAPEPEPAPVLSIPPLLQRATPLLTLYPSLLKDAAAHLDEKTCGSAYLFNAEPTVLQLWLTDKRRVLYEKNVFATIAFPADKCVQDLHVTLCATVKGIKTYKTRQGETQSVPQIDITAITCAGATYK